MNLLAAATLILSLVFSVQAGPEQLSIHTVQIPVSQSIQGKIIVILSELMEGQLYRVEHNTLLCPGDTIGINQTTSSLLLKQTIEPTHELQCVSNSTHYYPALRTFLCFAIIETLSQSHDEAIAIHITPSDSSNGLQLPESVYSGSVSVGILEAPVNLNSTLAVMTLDDEVVLLPKYAIVAGNDNNAFKIIHEQVKCYSLAKIVTTVALNTTALYNLTVEATAPTHSNSTTAIVMVHAISYNQHTPQFIDPPTVVIVSESAPMGFQIIQLHAVDMDNGPSGMLRYNLSLPHPQVDVNALTGQVYLKEHLDYETANETSITVVVYDVGEPSLVSEFTITIFITNINEYSPEIAIILYHSQVSEHLPQGSILARVNVNDADSNNISVTMTAAQCHNCFDLANKQVLANGTTQYDVIVAGKLDYELYSHAITLYITATDHDLPALLSTKTLVINILDENEPPYFNGNGAFHASIIDLQPVQSHVTTVIALDKDNGNYGNLTYTITSGNENNWFTINPWSGLIEVLNVINVALGSSINLTVSAQDTSDTPLSIEEHVIINIEDFDDSQPRFSKLQYQIEISESIDTATPIFAFSASDSDQGCSGAIEYSIINGEPSVFVVDKVSGLLYISEERALDYEQYDMAVVRVRATSLGGQDNMFTETVLNITVINENDNLPFIAPIQCPCFVYEEESTVQSCFNLSVIDVDGDAIELSITSGNEDSKFSIDAVTGLVSTTGTLDREEVDVHTLTIVASDGIHDSMPVTLVIKVVDIDDNAPTYLEKISLAPYQSLEPGDIVGNVAAIDVDAGYNALISHQFSNPPPNVSNTFRLDPLSGDLYLLNKLAQGHTYSFTITAEAISIEGNQVLTNVDITVQGDENEPPYFLRLYDERSVPRNLALSSAIVTVQAIDSNNDVIYYDIIDDSGTFSIDSATGTVTLASTLQDVTDSVITLNISANDSAMVAYTMVQLTLYDTTITVDGVELTQSPAVGVCAYNGTVLENSNTIETVIELSETQNGKSITYSIIGGDFKSAFKLNGYILQTKANQEESFDREEHQEIFLVLQAQYDDNLFHYCSATFDIIDVNDQSPQFLQILNTVEIYRAVPIDSSIFQFQATDSDTGSNAETSYKLTTLDNVPFIVENNTGIVRTTDILDGNSYTITVMAIDNDNINLNATAMLTIIILDKPNTSPSFAEALYVLEVMEDHAINVLLLNVTASDDDRGMHGDLSYCIQQGNYNDAFNPSKNGELCLKKPLDYETFPTIVNLTLLSYDSSPNPASTSTVIQVTISNVNDETPLFLAPQYFASVYETVFDQQPVITVTAVDRDSGSYGEVQYSIVPSDDRFSIDNRTGTIVTGSETIDRELIDNSTITLTVLASDGNGRNTSVTVDVTIRDINEHRPVFISSSSLTVAITESQQAGDIICTVETTDYDIGINGEVMVWIADGNADGFFLLNGQTGTLSLATTIDYEVHSGPYNLTVKARDFDGLDGVATLSIHIQIADVNDNRPLFTQTLYHCTINESSDMPMLDNGAQCQVTATDADITNNAVSYSIVNGSGFTIDSITGVLTADTSIDYETILQYVLYIVATDSGIPASTSSAVVVITVTDENDYQPHFDLYPTQLSVSESIPFGTELFYAHATDDDGSEEAISYTLLADTDKFTIDGKSGAIQTNAQLNFNEQSSYSITILATSNGDTLSTSKMYTISLLKADKNTGPPEISTETPTLVEVHDAANQGVHVATIAANIPHGTVHYYITGGSGYGYFTINSSTGAITVSQPLASLTDMAVTLDITALDDDAYPTPIIHTLTVVVTADPYTTKPFFTSPVFEMSVSEAESNKAGYIVGHVLALVNDRIENGTCYSLLSNDSTLPFSVNATTGAIFIDGSLNRELASFYQFHVEASRSGTNSSIALVNIAIGDINNYSPRIVPEFMSISIPQAYPVGLNHTFTKFFIIDKDIGTNAESTYTLEPPSSPFSIDGSSGEMYLNSFLVNDHYNVTVMVSNGDLTPVAVALTIATYSHSAAPSNSVPSFPSSFDSVSLSEDTNIGNLVYSAVATDGDGDGIFYSINKNPFVSYNKFSIHPTTGGIYLISLLDREEQESYSVTVEAWDGQNITTLTLLINVTDSNDNAPKFASPGIVFNTTESASIGTQLGMVVVKDNDSIANLPFTFVIKDTLPSFDQSFNITHDGALILNRPLDREKISQYQLTISVSDGKLNDFTRVTVQVEDTDDNAPMLIGNVPILYVYENISIGSHIYTVTGYDPDLNQASITNYSLLNAALLPFSIDEVTGNIVTTAAIDYGVTSEYTLELLLYNRYNPLSNSTVQLNVQVLDVVDTFPNISITPEVASIPENLPASTFVAATMSTSHPHPITYSIINGNDEGYFYIEAISGIIRTSVPLDHESQSQYVLTVRGNYDESYYTDVNVTISVVDVNDNAPTTTSTSLVFEVSEGVTMNTETIFRLCFIDGDDGINGDISNVVIMDSPASQTFSISTTGEATVIGILDHETQDLYEFQIIVEDGGMSPLYAILDVVVRVTDVNDNAPVFLQTSYNAIISAPLDITQPVLTVEATDADENPAIVYSISSGNEGNIFMMDQELGELFVINLYDIESLYTLVLAATDEGGLYSEVAATITIRYCNFNSLSFQPSSISLHIQESLAVDSSVIELVVNDFGTPGQLLYYFPVPMEHFYINSTTGQISVASELDREQDPLYKFVVQVQDTSSASLRLAEAKLEIILQDTNDNAPIFLNTPYVKFVVDDTLVGAQVFRATSNDIDEEGPNSSIYYSLITNPYKFFAIDSFSGVVTLLKALVLPDTETHVDVVIQASDKGSPMLSTNITLRLNVINSAAPNFSQSIYTVFISESTPIGSVVVQVVATASSEDSVIFYSIVDTNDPKFPFTISPTSGNITVNDRGLDYETEQEYSYYVRADDTITGYFSEVLVEVTISDYNDELPVFDEALYTQGVNENVTIGSTVLTVFADDDDSIPNAQLTYSLAASPDAALFKIHPTNGEISTVATLDYETQALYEFTVYANDSGTPSLQGSSTIRMVVNNINDNPPKITNGNAAFTVSELASPNTVIGFVTATDPDQDDITYSLVENLASENFTISHDGRLSVADIDDVVLRGPRYIVTVQANDGKFSTTKNITINVIDINDNSPVFQQSTYHSEIVENPSSSVYVATVLASDADHGTNGQITYSGNLNTQFSVNQSTGVITTADACDDSNCIDRETLEVYSLTVIARDGGGRTDTATVMITVLDVNDNTPSFTQNEFIAFIKEGTNEDLVLTVTASDPDNGINGTITYDIVDKLSLPFTLSVTTGDITVSGNLDYEAQSSYKFNVTATDGGGRTSLPTLVTINLINIADSNPEFLNAPYSASILEHSSQNEPIFTVNVSYAEGCIPNGFSILESEQPFEIDDAGTLKVDGTLDREERDRYIFTIQVECTIITDNSMLESRFDFASVNVKILDKNEKPKLEEISTEAISELVPVNTTVTLVSATDDDIGDNAIVQYRIVSSMDVPFDIEENGGFIYVSEPLDRESMDASHFLFNVEAYDLGSPSLKDSEIVVIFILDENDSPPTFICDSDEPCIYDVSIPENTPLNTSIITLATEDADLISQVDFSLSTELFSVATTGQAAVVSTAIVLDYESTTDYSIVVLANDGVYTASAELVVNVTDVNDNSPVFTEAQYEVTVPERYSVNVTFTTVLAIDADDGDNAIVTYSILSSPEAANVSLNGNTGEVWFNAPPDYETSSRLELHIQAIDTGGLDDFTFLLINIMDINDNKPVFTMTNYSASIAENKPPGTVLLYTIATDEDSGDNGLLYYYLHENSQEYFTISLSSGLITTKTEIDREQTPSLQLTVIARDAGNVSLSSEATVVIEIEDINDNPPVFDNEHYVAHIPESMSVGTSVIDVYVTDPDQGSNAELIFDLTGPNNDDFSHESISGGVRIKVADVLNHESISKYQLSLRAIDNGFPSQEATADIVINVGDENDNQPQFDFPLYQAALDEDVVIGTVVKTVHATDLDSDDANLIYSFKEPQEHFLIDPSTGDVTVKASLDYESIQKYMITVVATEPRLISQSDEADITITINDVNDNPPQFLCPSSPDVNVCNAWSTTITENMSPHLVVDLTVRDLDTVTNINAITFKIVSGNNKGLFSINPIFGLLNTTNMLDREDSDKHVVIIAATDDGGLTGYITVTIIVGDVNDNAPEPSVQNIAVYLYEEQLGQQYIGRVLNIDDDLYNNHSYAITSVNLPRLSILSDGLIVASSIFPGSFSLNVRIHDTLYNNTTVFCDNTLNVIVKNVDKTTVENSFIIVLESMYYEIFIQEYLNLFQSEISEMLSKYHSIKLLYVFSIQPSSIVENSTELTLAAFLNNGAYLEIDLFQHYLYSHRNMIEDVLNASIYTEDLTYCDIEPCSSNGICSTTMSYSTQSNVIGINSTTSYLGLKPSIGTACTCAPGYTGSTCSDAIAHCGLFDCQNGAECIGTPEVVGCACRNGYIGENCSIPYPATNLCVTATCFNGATCTSSHAGFTCTCPQGFTGVYCNISTTDNSGCHGNPCLHGGACVWSAASETEYSCDCPAGYGGLHCQRLVYDVDADCRDCTCIYSEGKTTCIASTGTSCDIVDCTEPYYCSGQGMCIDDCSPNPCKEGTCIPLQPGYYCICPAGRDGRNCELTIATFTPTTQIMFPSPPSHGEIMLDIITEGDDGLLLYSSLYNRDGGDYILLGIAHGHVQCNISYGGAQYQLVAEDIIVSNHQWYTISLIYDAKV